MEIGGCLLRVFGAFVVPFFFTVLSARTCEDHACPGGYVYTNNDADIDGLSFEAMDKQCCQKTCELHPCISPLTAKPDTAFNTTLDDETCCIKETCAFFNCSQGYEKNPKTSASTDLSKENCCLPVEERNTCSKRFKCAPKNYLDPAKLNSTILTEANCCLPGLNITSVFPQGCKSKCYADLSGVNALRHFRNLKCCCPEFKRKDKSTHVCKLRSALHGKSWWMDWLTDANGCGTLVGTQYHEFTRQRGSCIIAKDDTFANQTNVILELMKHWKMDMRDFDNDDEPPSAIRRSVLHDEH